MKKLAPFLSIFIFCTIMCSKSNALDLSGNLIVSGNYGISEDINVHEGVLFEAHSINVLDSLHISNLGEIHGEMTVYSGRTLELENTGVFDATVSLQSGARLLQVISSNETITDIGLTSGFDVTVRNASGVDINSVMQIVGHADSIKIENARLVARDMSSFVAPNDVTLSGDIILSFDNVSNTDLLLFRNASGDGVVYVDSYALDKLHLFETYKINQDIFVRLTRSTDYARILNNDMGRFLNNLRASGTDTKLFAKLDIVETMDELDDVLSKSVRTNPIKLMQPMSLMYSYKTLEIMHIDDGMVFGVEPIMIYSQDALIYGVRPNVAFNISDDLHLKLSGYMLNFDYVDDINEYNGYSFGLDADMQYDILKDNFVRLHLGGGKSYFDIGPVFDGVDVINNPDGTSLYAIGEIGHVFDIGGGYKLSPFAGISTEYLGILNLSDTKVYGIGGTDLGYEYEFDGLSYDYSARLIARTDGMLGAGINVSVWSIFDAAGVDVHIGTIYDDDFGISFNVAVNGRFRF